MRAEKAVVEDKLGSKVALPGGISPKVSAESLFQNVAYPTPVAYPKPYSPLGSLLEVMVETESGDA